jgi:hypothetical protein
MGRHRAFDSRSAHRARFRSCLSLDTLTWPPKNKANLMAPMWMVRAKGGLLYEEFRDKAVAAIGWVRIAEDASQGATREQLADAY